MTDPAPRFCREVREQLPALASGELTGWSERIVRAHLKRCVDCAAEAERQGELAAGLAALRAAPPAPPAQLLDSLLDTVGTPSLRARAAVPARGAVSGARPGLSVTFLAVGALGSTAIGWAAWQGARRGMRAARRRG
jgi:predicted anti-sigma-YlaC factor YlaD